MYLAFWSIFSNSKPTHSANKINRSEIRNKAVPENAVHGRREDKKRYSEVADSTVASLVGSSGTDMRPRVGSSRGSHWKT